MARLAQHLLILRIDQMQLARVFAGEQIVQHVTAQLARRLRRTHQRDALRAEQRMQIVGMRELHDEMLSDAKHLLIRTPKNSRETRYNTPPRALSSDG